MIFVALTRSPQERRAVEAALRQLPYVRQPEAQGLSFWVHPSLEQEARMALKGVI